MHFNLRSTPLELSSLTDCDPKKVFHRCETQTYIEDNLMFKKMTLPFSLNLSSFCHRSVSLVGSSPQTAS